MGNPWLERPDTSIFDVAWNHIRQIHPELCINFQEDDNPVVLTVSHDDTLETVIFMIALDVIQNTIRYYVYNGQDVDYGEFDPMKDIRFLIDQLLILTGLGA